MNLWIYFNISSPNSSDQNNDGSADNGEHHPVSDDVPPTSQSTEEANEEFKKEEEEQEKEQNLTSTPDKVPSTLAPLQLSQLRTKNTNSFDIEEVHDILGAVKSNTVYLQYSDHVKNRWHLFLFVWIIGIMAK